MGLITAEGLNNDAVTVMAGMFVMTYELDLLSTFVAIGACAGFASEMAIWKELVEPRNAPPEDFFIKATTSSGEHLYISAAATLFLADMPSDRLSFLSLAGSLVSPPETLHDIREIIAHVVSTYGNATFGHPRLPSGLLAKESPLNCILRTWKNVKFKFEAERRPAREWPLLLGAVAYRLIAKHTDKITPAAAVRIMLESAFPMNRIDPALIPSAEFTPPPFLMGQNGRAINPAAHDEIVADVRAVMPTELIN